MMSGGERRGGVGGQEKGDGNLPDSLLVCPLDGGTLDRDARQFTCKICGRTYPVHHGIPDMTIRQDEQETGADSTTG